MAAKTLEELLEIEAIKELKYRYMTCIDRKRWEELGTLLTDDVTSSYSGGKYTFEGKPALLEFLSGSMGSQAFYSSHRVHHPIIALTSATTATGDWALEDTVIEDRHKVTIRGAAFYRDEYVKQGGEWKIRHTGYERTYEEMESRKDGAVQLTARQKEGVPVPE